MQGQQLDPRRIRTECWRGTREDSVLEGTREDSVLEGIREDSVLERD